MNISNGSSVKGVKKDVSFGAHKKFIDNQGEQSQKFFMQFDPAEYKNVSVKIYKLSKDPKTGDYYVAKEDQNAPKAALQLNSKGEAPDFYPERVFGSDYNTKDGFAYRFELKDKNDKLSYGIDAGSAIGMLNSKGEMDDTPENKFNFVLKNGAVLTKPGKMTLIHVDSFNPGYQMGKDGNIVFVKKIKDKALNSVRTHINKMGGTFAGVIDKLDDLFKQGYNRIVGLPFTKDTVSSHGYWTQNAFQVSPQYGSLSDFKKLQTELYKRGMNWVSDAALVNEGLEGIHFANVLKWGKNSPFYNWFKINGLDSGVLTMGILPKDATYTGYKYINAPFNADNEMSKNEHYDPSQPTYVQFFDKRLADEDQQTDDKFIDTYEKNNTENKYDITSHDDTVYPYHFEVKPDLLKSRVESYKETCKKLNSKPDVQSLDAIREIMQFDTFKIDHKNEGGFVDWDGNVDIAKLNFGFGADDDKKYDKYTDPAEKAQIIRDEKEGILAVQDYAINSGKYWTKLCSDVPISYTANLLKQTPADLNSYISKFDKLGKQLPANLSENINAEVIQNVLKGTYKSRILANKDNAMDLLTRNAMDYPLETLPVNDDLLAVLTSPYITKRPSIKEELGISKFDIYKANNKNLNPKYKAVAEKADSFYAKDFAGFASQILNSVNLDIFNNGEVTNLGKFVINDAMPDLLNFAILKAINPDLDIHFAKDGSLDLSGIDSKSLSLGSLGINESTPEKEAAALIQKMSANLNSISAEDKNELIAALNKRFENADETSFRMAEMIVDRTETGLGWRIDASKDVGSIDSVRNNDDQVEQTWDKVTDFWKTFTDGVMNINQHSFTTSEITDTGELFSGQGKGGYNPDAKYHCNIDAETKSNQRTGIAGAANYFYYFSALPQIYAKSFEDGQTSGVGNPGIGNVDGIRDKNIGSTWGGNPMFFHQSAIEGILHSYTFIGNHDKPRALHCLALDMELFYAKQDKLNGKYYETVKDVLGSRIPSNGTDGVKAPAIAMGSRLKQSIQACGVDPDVAAKLYDAISILASGKNDSFDAAAFGSRTIDTAINDVFTTAKENGLNIDDASADKIKADMFENIMRPAYDKYYSIYKTQVTLPGDVTDFAGDKVGMTGYESKAKNYCQQNRNVIDWDYIDENSPKYKEHVAEFNFNMNEILDFRNRPELSALNDGNPVSLPNTTDGFYSLLRYNDKDSMTITVYNASGATADNDRLMDRQDAPIKRIQLTGGNSREGLSGGLPVGTIFKSTNPDDEDLTFEVVKRVADSKGRIEGEDGFVASEAKENYFLENTDGDIVVKPEDYNALVLYKEPGQ